MAPTKGQRGEQQVKLAPGARMIHIWMRTTPDVTRFVATKDTAEAAEKLWAAAADGDAGVGCIELDSYPNGEGRRQKLLLRASDVAAMAFDRPTLMAAEPQPILRAAT